MSAPQAPFRRIVVVGLGLLGGSIAAGARARGLGQRVVGTSRSRETAARAIAEGVVDEAGPDLAALASGADLVVLATPVSAMAESLAAIAPALSAGAIVTDVGSVKGSLAETLPGLLPEGVSYVGSHPMAGGHESGLAHARADLLEGTICVVTASPSADPRAVDRVRGFWAALGARAILRDAARHDTEVAWISHAPHAAAFAFAHALADSPEHAGDVLGAGFRDFTRIARSEPELWADILVQNRKALAGPLTALAERLGTVARLIESGDADALERFLAQARETLAAWADDARSGGENPEIQVAPSGATPKE